MRLKLSKKDRIAYQIISNEPEWIEVKPPCLCYSILLSLYFLCLFNWSRCTLSSSCDISFKKVKYHKLFLLSFTLFFKSSATDFVDVTRERAHRQRGKNIFSESSPLSNSYSHFHNILRLFDVLPNTSFTASENDARLLLINILYTCYLTSCWLT